MAAQHAARNKSRVIRERVKQKGQNVFPGMREYDEEQKAFPASCPGYFIVFSKWDSSFSWNAKVAEAESSGGHMRNSGGRKGRRERETIDKHVSCIFPVS